MAFSLLINVLTFLSAQLLTIHTLKCECAESHRLTSEGPFNQIQGRFFLSLLAITNGRSALNMSGSARVTRATGRCVAPQVFNRTLHTADVLNVSLRAWG